MKRPIPTAMLVALTLLFYAVEGSAEQTRHQCRECCAKLGLDEYYTEQCRLRCFRNPDSCANIKRPAEQAAPQEPSGRRPPPDEEDTPPGPPQPPPQVQRPPEARRPNSPPQTQGPPPRARRPQAAAGFTFPNPLDLTAGREWEAAAQIVAINGIGPGHPNHQAAVKNVEQLLINFARNNPSGGKLPVADLQNILKALR